MPGPERVEKGPLGARSCSGPGSSSSSGSDPESRAAQVEARAPVDTIGKVETRLHHHDAAGGIAVLGRKIGGGHLDVVDGVAGHHAKDRKIVEGARQHVTAQEHAILVGGGAVKRQHAQAHGRSRDAGVRALASGVDKFLSPSRFVADELVRWGLDAGRVEHLGTGLAEGDMPARVPRADVVRVRFLGSLIPSKGAHVLVDAWSRLSPAARARGELVLFGPPGHDAAYTASLERAVEAAGARWGGLLDRDEVPRELAQTDLVCLPSLWFENLPLVILEARAAGVPLLVSDLGGLSEAVSDSAGGWRFDAGDPAALAAKLEELLLEPSALDAMEVPPAPGADAHFERLFEVFHEVKREQEGSA